MRVNISLSAKISTMTYLDEESKKWIAHGEKQYRSRTGGTWIKADFADPNFSLKVLKYKDESDSYRYVAYLMDLKTKRFVGVFNLEPWHQPGDILKFYHPTSYLQAAYRGQGLFKKIYVWALEKGLNLHTELEQTVDSSRMWQKLSKEYQLVCLPSDKSKKHKLSDLMGDKFLTTPGYYSILFSKKIPPSFVRDYVKQEMSRK